jgi:hypothetical protein
LCPLIGKVENIVEPGRPKTTIGPWALHAGYRNL